MATKTILITGVSTGLGRALAVEALEQGHRVIGTVRTGAAREAFESLKPGAAFGRLLDVRDDAAVAKLVEDFESGIGPIDVLVNNAGYGHEGTLEESPMEELRDQFAVNVFGAVAAMKAVLPFMRQRRKGHILNVTSMGGLMTMPGISFYHGSKFALEGLSASLGKEVKPLGIFVTAVAPGMFRTDWAGRSMVRSGRRIPAYDEIFEPIRKGRLERNGRQPGDPSKAARAILEVIASDEPPTHLLLGPDAVRYVRAALDELNAEITKWESLSASTNFDTA